MRESAERSNSAPSGVDGITCSIQRVRRALETTSKTDEGEGVVRRTCACNVIARRVDEIKVSSMTGGRAAAGHGVIDDTATRRESSAPKWCDVLARRTRGAPERPARRWWKTTSGIDRIPCPVNRDRASSARREESPPWLASPRFKRRPRGHAVAARLGMQEPGASAGAERHGWWGRPRRTVPAAFAATTTGSPCGWAPQSPMMRRGAPMRSRRPVMSPLPLIRRDEVPPRTDRPSQLAAPNRSRRRCRSPAFPAGADRTRVMSPRDHDAGRGTRRRTPKGNSAARLDPARSRAGRWSPRPP